MSYFASDKLHMRLSAILFLLVISSVTRAPSAAALQARASADALRPADYAVGEILVKFRKPNRRSALKRYRLHNGMERIRSFPSIDVDHLLLPQQMNVEEALQLLAADPGVLYAEPNYFRHTSDIPSGPLFSRLWGLHNTGQAVDDTAGTADADIDAPEAWDITTGSDEVVVAVIDSGLDFSHPDLAANIWSNPREIAGNGVDDDGNGYIDDMRGWDFVNNDNAPLANDASGHGTHVSGTIAADGGETTGMTGVSRQVRIMSLRTFNGYGAGDTASAILAFEYAGAMGAGIINCSWGGTGYSQALKDAIEASAALVVCAAGNSGSDSDIIPHYPAAYDSANIVSAAASDASDIPAAFSNYGAAAVDLAAPGVNILSCSPGRRTVWIDDFDDGAIDDWTSGGPNNDWGLTNLESNSAPYSLADSPDGDYSQRTNSWIRPPAFDLSSVRNAAFEFTIRGASESIYDNLQVEVSTDGVAWLWKPVKLSGVGIVNAVSGTLLTWTNAVVDLSDYDGLPSLQVRFSFLTDWTNNRDGWYLDDVALTASSTVYNGTEHRSMDGTSMAAAHVSGAAALIRAEHPALSAVEVKSALVANVDYIAALEGLVASGGRLNAFHALSRGTLHFDAAAYETEENVPGFFLTVNRTGSGSGEVSVSLEITGGTALEGEDFTLSAHSLFWASGETGGKKAAVEILNDLERELPETIEITLKDATGLVDIGVPAKTVVTIADDDAGSDSFWPMVLPAILNSRR